MTSGDRRKFPVHSRAGASPPLFPDAARGIPDPRASVFAWNGDAVGAVSVTMVGIPGSAANLFEISERKAAVHKGVAEHSLSLWRRWVLNSAAILFADTCALSAAGLVVAGSRYLVLGPGLFTRSMLALIPAWWLVSAAGNLYPGWGLSTSDHLRRVVMLLTGLFALAALLAFFTPSHDYGRQVSFGAMWVLSVGLVPLFRTLATGFLCARKLYGMPTVIFGRSALADDIAERLHRDPRLGYQPIGICTDDCDETDGLPVVGRLDQTMPLAPVAIIVSSGLPKETSERLVRRAVGTYRRVLILPDLGDIPSLWVSPRDLDGMVGLEISQTLLSPLATMIKRVVDLALVGIAAPVWVPVCSIICVCILLDDRRNPLFRQPRSGRGGEPFFAYKFRTMVTGAEEVLRQRLATDPDLRAEWETHFKLRHDPRITRVGRLLRRTSLDELPQLFNVLEGTMSLVGPRPLPLYHLERLPTPVREHRARMRPGLTGLWQVSGRSDAGTDGMARWDPYYVRNWSIWLDIVILVRTVRVVISGSGAR